MTGVQTCALPISEIIVVPDGPTADRFVPPEAMFSLPAMTTAPVVAEPGVRPVEPPDQLVTSDVGPEMVIAPEALVMVMPGPCVSVARLYPPVLVPIKT